MSRVRIRCPSGCFRFSVMGNLLREVRSQKGWRSSAVRAQKRMASGTAGGSILITSAP
jgi:hypothetical protein